MAIGVTPVYIWFTTMAHHTGIELDANDLEKQIASTPVRGQLAAGLGHADGVGAIGRLARPG